MDKAFKETKVGGLIQEGASLDQIQSGVEVRVRNMRTLPAMPEIVLRIMKLVGDPNSSAQDMEDLLLSDVAIAEKLGAVAQQVKMMNSFAKPEESKFDLRRLWEHSVGCSMLADKIIRQ